MPLPQRKTTHLRWGRVSAPGATYFVTPCTQAKTPVLIHPETATRIIAALREMHTAHDIDLLAAILMPDHAHLLFILGMRLRLGQVLAKFKTLARDNGRASWRWQEDSFEHRVRAHDSTEDYAFYIFMNPYRSGLISLRERWPWWLCPDPSRFLFLGHLEEGGPIPSEWVGESQRIATHLVHRA